MRELPENDLVFYSDASIKIEMNFKKIFNIIQKIGRIFFYDGFDSNKQFFEPDII